MYNVSVKTIILCGGAGTRLKEETEFKPKPMVYVGGKPILWHIMKMYANYGYNEFILALGYKADYIKDYFLNQKAFNSDFTLETQTHKIKYHFDHRKEVDNFKITFVDTGLETMPGERMLRCREYLNDSEERFMMTYGDAVSSINISKLIKFHKQQKTIATLTGIHPTTKYGMIELGKDALVKSFTEKPILNDYANGGFMVFKKTIFDYIKSGETEQPALKRLAKISQLSLYRHDDFWYCMDTYKEVEKLNEMWKAQDTPWKTWK